jgi:hypothetical protein
MAKAAAARLRRTGALPTADEWAARAQACERCHLRVVRNGTSYCGTPFLQQVNRDPALDGCGCPTRDKARAPGEHCPLSTQNLVASIDGGHCDCKWCSLGAAERPTGRTAAGTVRFQSLSA